jgi:hypothetical protein
MENKIIEAFLVIIIIECFLALFLVMYVLIQIIVCDYKAWKRNKAEEDRYRKMEDKFKNRKLTD